MVRFMLDKERIPKVFSKWLKRFVYVVGAATLIFICARLWWYEAQDSFANQICRQMNYDRGVEYNGKIACGHYELFPQAE